ncbi:MFS transporter [Cedecea sp. NFIX57]|uniref:MFS transporter n=1 Tax=Cedecea sp. NFIX57 TaxID=1566286 RepID=UPI0015943AC1|nr:MFS transporter [Cedecea sp. NFIX57]
MQSYKKSALTLFALYFLNGVIFSTWGVFIPWLKEAHQVSNSLLSIALFSMSLGAILAMKRLGLWVSSMGAKKAIGLFSVLYPLSLWLVFLSPSFAASCLLLMVFGLALAVLDVATNVEATAVERASGHKFMSKLHGMFSLGGIGGSLAGLLSHRLTFPTLYYLSAVLIAAAIVSFLLARTLPETAPTVEDATAEVRQTEGKLSLWVLGGLAFLALLCEGAIYDWSTLYMQEFLHPEQSRAYLGYAFFSVGMTAGRFSGDTLRRAVREKTLLSLMATLGFTGMSIVLLSSSPGNALVGFLLLGLGISTLVPLMFIIAASQGEGDASKEIALVTRMAYTGMLLGPVIIGALSGWLGLQLALWLVAILLAGIALTAKAMRPSVPPATHFS